MYVTKRTRSRLQTKLTLRMELMLIERAKVWARENGVSLSEAVASFFQQVLRDKPPRRTSAWTRSFAGAAATDASPPSDSELREEYRAHLERKHG